MPTWFTADLHFGHKGVLAYAARPWATVDEMNEALIWRWNRDVAPTDTVWVLGDFSFLPRVPSLAIFERLNGHKHLIRGNHDERCGDRLPWESVRDLHVFREGGTRLVLCHYPLLTWRHAHKGAGHLHGHSHGNLQAPPTTRLDVGVDTHDWRPWSLAEVLAVLATRTYHFIDHHRADAEGPPPTSIPRSPHGTRMEE